MIQRVHVTWSRSCEVQQEPITRPYWSWEVILDWTVSPTRGRLPIVVGQINPVRTGAAEPFINRQVGPAPTCAPRFPSQHSPAYH